MNNNNENNYNMNMQNSNQNNSNNYNTRNNNQNVMNNQETGNMGNGNNFGNMNNVPKGMQYKKNQGNSTLIIAIVEICFSVIGCFLCLQGNSVGPAICLVSSLIVVLTYIIFKNIKSKNTSLCLPVMVICIVGILISASGICRNDANNKNATTQKTTVKDNTNTKEVSNKQTSSSESKTKSNDDVVVQEERQVKDVQGAMQDTAIDTTKWNDIERYPDKYLNSHVGFVGKVVYTSEGKNNEVKLLIDEQGGTTIKVTYKYGKDQGRILSGDEIAGIGAFQGLDSSTDTMEVNADVIGPADFRSALLIMNNFASKVQGGMEVKYLGKLNDLGGDTYADYYTFKCPTDGKYYVYKEKILYLYDVKTKQMETVYGAC